MSNTTPADPKASEKAARYEQAKKGQLFSDIAKHETIEVGDSKTPHSWEDLTSRINEKKAVLADKAASADLKKTTKAELKPLEEAAVKLRDSKVAAPRYTEFNKLPLMERTTAKVGANWHQASKLGKGVRVLGTSLGVVLVGKGLKDIFMPSRDEKGERKTGLLMSVGEAGTGALAIYAALLHGGANKAMGLHI